MLIKNGTISTENETFCADILIENGVIIKIAENITLNDNDNRKVIDANGKHVLPGGVDVHTHFDLNLGSISARDDFLTGTIAAACGGTTTIVDHIGFGKKGCKLSEPIEHYHKIASGKAVVDYSFHGVIARVDDEILAEMESLIDSGITSYKLYMTYDNMLSDLDILKVMARTKELGLMLCVHAENDGIIKYFKQLFKSQGSFSPEFHAKSRADICEFEAVNRLISFSQLLNDAPLYIVHLSTQLSLECCKTARLQGLNNLFVETCPQYLLLDDSLYLGDDGLKFVLSPPLRKQSDAITLWNGLKNGDIQTVATDHCPFNFATDKQLGKEDFAKCPNGLPAVETRIPLMFSEGVLGGKLSLNEFVKVYSTNPAKLFGMYPQKGTIAVGSDADLVIIDPKKSYTITHKNLHENVDYTPYEGFKVNGKIDYTISRGEIIVENNEFVGEKGRGLFIKRNKPIISQAQL